MKLVVNNNKEKLKQLLYAKKIAETQIDEMKAKVVLFENLDKALAEKLNDKKLSAYDKAKFELERVNNTWEGKKATESLKTRIQIYETYFMPEIDKIANEEDKKSIEFLDLEKEAEEMAQYELWGKTVKLFSNVEHPFVISEYEKEIELTEAIINEGLKKQNEKDPKDKYEQLLIQREVLESTIHLRTLKKRLNSRIEYYQEQFLPKYTIELAEAKEMIGGYKDRAVLIHKATQDVPLAMMLQRYDEHAKDDEKLWQFYTALKDRVIKGMEVIKASPNRYSNAEELISEITPKAYESKLQ